MPAGWYPDPLGLPQLRWWDAQAWTEHTSEARAPIVVQPVVPTKLAFADDELPSRREQRERERAENSTLLDTQLETETDSDHEELSAQPLLAMTLKELEAPLAESVEEANPSPRRATWHANVQTGTPALSALADELPVEPARSRTKTYTVASWTIALMPILQLVTSALLITAAGYGHNVQLMLLVVFGPYVLVLGLAAYDSLRLHVWGYKKPASAWWALLTEPGYLIVRGIRTHRETGKGFAPIAIFASSIVLVLASVVAVPGLIISLLPAVFASEVQSSVEADASALGAKIRVSCPSPPLIIGETFTCTATKPSGDSDSIAVSLERQNGWINWRVEDWGVWVLTAK